MEQTAAVNPGIYNRVDFDTYRTWQYINNSSLSPALRSMAHYRHALDDGAGKSSDALRFGTICHEGILEPLAAMGTYVVMPDFVAQLKGDYKSPRATKEYRELVDEFKRVNCDKEIVTQQEFDDILGVATALHSNERVQRLLEDRGPVESSIVWDDPATHLRCKARIDKVCEQYSTIVDLKTTGDAVDFERSMYRWGYARQGAFYTDGMRALTGRQWDFCIAVVEREAPYGLRTALLSQEALDYGRSQYLRLLHQIAQCQATGDWPGYDDPPEWNLPGWVEQEVTLMVHGQLVSM